MTKVIDIFYFSKLEHKKVYPEKKAHLSIEKIAYGCLLIDRLCVVIFQELLDESLLIVV